MIRKIIKFKKHWHVYGVGEIAAFQPSQCERLIATGYAVAHGPVPQRDGERLKHVAQDAANLKAIQTAPNTKQILPDKNKGKGNKGKK